MNHSVEGMMRPPRGAGPEERRNSSSSSHPYRGPCVASGTPVPPVPPAPQCPDCNEQMVQINDVGQHWQHWRCIFFPLCAGAVYDL
eukprot:11607453-Prorocentrum_lima.AAC.1